MRTLHRVIMDRLGQSLPRLRRVRQCLAVLVWGVALSGAPIAGLADTGLPAELDAALLKANLPRDALSLVVQELPQGGARPAPRYSHREQVPVNPASVMKLVTTYAGLDALGPAFTWTTPVYLDGVVKDGSLQGHLVIKGQGDPKLVVERVWLLLRKVQALGIRRIEGDIVLDRSAFELPEADPAGFDGEPFRAYNVAPDALLMNYKAVSLTLVPDRAAGLARVSAEPPLAGVSVPATVPLEPGDCADYRASLKADFSDPARIRLAGGFPASCGEKLWHVAYAEPRSYAGRLIEALWLQLGGSLTGRVREGRVPAGLRPAFEFASPPLAEVVRDINKFSNNVMAQQLFLTLPLVAPRRTEPGGAVARLDSARDWVLAWWKERWPQLEPPVLDNGSGLSRSERISAAALAQLLVSAYQSPVMSELMSSLPVAGVDGTLRRRPRSAQGSAHLKTGSLRDVAAIAGYVLTPGGKRFAVVAIVNHPTQAAAARAVFDTLLEGLQKDK